MEDRSITITVVLKPKQEGSSDDAIVAKLYELLDPLYERGDIADVSFNFGKEVEITK